jgi:hypothetical protein
LGIALLTSRASHADPQGTSRETGARASPTPGQVQAARELFIAASKEEDAGHWIEALDKLQRVADVKLTAGVRYHIALCEEKLGRIATALDHYTEALDAAKQEHNKDVEGLLQPPFLSDLAARVPKLTITVPSDVSGAVVTVDGHIHPRGLWGVPVPMDPGAHRVEARENDREPFFRDLVLHEREVTSLDVVLSAHASPSPAVPSGAFNPTLASPAQETTGPATSAPPAVNEAAHAHRSLVVPVVLGVGALALAGGGVGAYVAAGSAQDQGRAQCLTQINCDSLRTPVRTWDYAALGMWIGAGVLATTAIVVMVLPGKSTSVHLSAGLTQARLEGTF